MITQTIHVDSQYESIHEAITWKRFSEITRLYREMYHLHTARGRDELFPPILQSKVFG